MFDKDYNKTRDYLYQFDDGKVELKKDVENGIAYICLNHPQRKNAISGRMMVELRDCIMKLEEWKEGKALIIYGIGSNFCSGGDLNFASKSGGPIGANHICTWMYDTMRRLQNLNIITLCVVHGPTLGSGAEISIYCDYILSTDNLQYGFVQGKMGILTVFGGSTRLAHTLGRTTALDLLLTSKILSANDCLEMGIVQHIIPGKDILKEATEWLQPRVHLPTEVIRGYKDVISNAIHSTFYESLDYEMKRFTPFWGGDLNVNALTKRVKHVK